MSHTKNKMRPQVKANGLKDHQVAGLATFVTDRVRDQILIRLPEHLRQTVVVAIQDFLSKNELLIDLRKTSEVEPKDKTLGEILYDAFEDRLGGCDEWSRTSDKFKSEYEDAADAVQQAVTKKHLSHVATLESNWMSAMGHAEWQCAEWEKKFHGAMELAKTHMQHAADYTKERDAYMKSYNEVCQRWNELEQEIAKLKEQLKESQSQQSDSKQIKIGSIVRHVDKKGLFCGSGIYADAVVASIDPLIVVSREGDMVWHHQDIGNLVTAGVLADASTMRIVEDRLRSDASQYFADKEPSITIEIEKPKDSQRNSLYVLIVRDEVGEDFSVCSFMQPTVTHSQMSAIVNILSEQLADGIGNLSEFQNKKESLQ